MKRYSKNEFNELCILNGCTSFVLDESVEFNGTQTYMVSSCKKCGHRVKLHASKFRNDDARCCICGGGQPKTSDEWLIRFEYNNPDRYKMFYWSKFVITRHKDKTNVGCTICGYWWETTPNRLDNGCGCPNCARGRTVQSRKLNTYEVIKRFIKIHGDKYDYTKVVYIGIYNKVCIICPEHGEFWQTPNNHIHSKNGCPICNESHGELDTAKWLDTHGITYERQKQFEGLVGVSGWYELPFDFYLLNYPR